MAGGEEGAAQPLFRPEVVQRSLPSRFGGTLEDPSIPLRRYVILALAFLVLLLVYLGVARFRATVSAAGVLVPVQGAVRVAAAAQGRFHSIRIDEGQQVARGEILAVIDTGTRDGAGVRQSGREQEYIARRIAHHRRQLALVEETWRAARSRHRERRRDLRRARELLVEQAGIMQERVNASRASLRSRQALNKQGLLADVTFRSHRERHLALVQEQSQLERNVAGLEQRLHEVDDTLRQARLERRRRRQELQARIADRRHEAGRLEGEARVSVVAPADGVIGPVSVVQGDPTRAGSLLTTIIPGDASLHARLYLPGSAMTSVGTGQTVQLTYEAYPYQRYGNHEGRVAGISDTTIDPREQRVLLPDIRQPVYQVDVTLPAQRLLADGVAYPLRSGMRLRAEIVTSEMTLLEFLLDPVLRLLRKQELP